MPTPVLECPYKELAFLLGCDPDVVKKSVFEVLAACGPNIVALATKVGHADLLAMYEPSLAGLTLGMGSSAHWNDLLDKGASLLRFIHSQATPQKIVPGDLWMHFKGGTYEIVSLATLLVEPKDIPAVVYQDDRSENSYVRSEIDFRAIVRWGDGEYRPRFIRVGTKEYP